MVIHQAQGLQVGVHDRGPHEGEAPLLERLAQGLGLRGHGRNLRQGARMVHLRRPAHEGPQEGVEAAEFLLHRQEGAGVLPGGEDLQAVAHDSRILEGGLQLGVGHGGDFDGVEPEEDPPVGLPLPEDGDPAEPGLGAFQHQLLEEAPVIVLGDAPFLVVVGDVERILATPSAAFFHAPPAFLYAESGGCAARFCEGRKA